jgi:hypothetical protein
LNQFFGRASWHTRKKLQHEFKVAVLRGLSQAGIERGTLSTRVGITIIGRYTGRALDHDNIAAKLIIDPLKGYLLTDDSPEYIAWVKLSGSKSDRPGTEIILEQA